jgi:hypothetical protein
LDPLRDDPRFEAILAARGLAGRRPVRLPPGRNDSITSSAGESD